METFNKVHIQEEDQTSYKHELRL